MEWFAKIGFQLWVVGMLIYVLKPEWIHRKKEDGSANKPPHVAFRVFIGIVFGPLWGVMAIVMGGVIFLLGCMCIFPLFEWFSPEWAQNLWNWFWTGPPDLPKPS